MNILSFINGWVVIFGFSLFLTFLLSSFFFWKSLREDYEEKKILGGSLFVIAFAFIVEEGLIYLLKKLGFDWSFYYRIVFLFFFWGAVLGAKYWSWRFKMNVWEVLDAMGVGIGFFLIWAGGLLFSQSRSLIELGYVLFGFLVVVALGWLKNKYRSFLWYKSGKSGFLFGVAGGILSLGFFGLAFFDKSSIYLERLLETVSLVIIFCLVYKRSERKFKEDLQEFSKHFIKLFRKNE